MYMDYKGIYDAICERGQVRLIDETKYYEKHHIIPKCMGGTDDATNLTILTYREHFLVHWILHRIHPDNKELGYAFFAMTLDKYGNRNHTISARALEEAKKAYISSRIGSQHSEETKQKIRKSCLGRPSGNKGIKASQSARQKMAVAKLGRKRTDEECEAISNGKREWYKNNESYRTGKSFRHKTKWWDAAIRTERMDKVKILYETGMAISHITNEVEVTRPTIYSWIKKYGWERK